MLLAIAGAVIRTVLAGYGGSLVQEGYITADDVNAASGAVIIIVTLGWSIWQKKRASKNLPWRK